jgi:protein-disulfide isomerase
MKRFFLKNPQIGTILASKLTAGQPAKEVNTMNQAWKWQGILLSTLIAGVLFGMVSCGKGAFSEKKAGATLAQVGGDTLSDSDLEESIQRQLDRSEWRYKTETYRLRKDALGRTLEEKLLAKEAESQSISVGELVQKEIRSKIEDPTDEVVQAYIQAHSDRFSKELSETDTRRASLIVRRAKEEEARKAYFDQLKKEYKVKVLLEYPTDPRFEVSAAEDPAQGPDKAKVLVVEFGDYTSPITRDWNALRKSVVEKYSGKVRWVFRDAPNDLEGVAGKAAMAAQCAGTQGKFWEYHDLVLGQEAFKEENLKSFAQSTGLDSKTFEECLSSGKFKEEIQEDLRDARRTGAGFPPALYINGILVIRGVPAEEIEQILEAEL